MTNPHLVMSGFWIGGCLRSVATKNIGLLSLTMQYLMIQIWCNSLKVTPPFIEVFWWRPTSREKHFVALSLRCKPTFNRCCLSVPFVKGGAVENGLKNSPCEGEGWVLCFLPLLTCLVHVLLVDLWPINWSLIKYVPTTLPEVKGALLQGPWPLKSTGKTLNLTSLGRGALQTCDEFDKGMGWFSRMFGWVLFILILLSCDESCAMHCAHVNQASLVQMDFINWSHSLEILFAQIYLNTNCEYSRVLAFMELRMCYINTYIVYTGDMVYVTWTLHTYQSKTIQCSKN